MKLRPISSKRGEDLAFPTIIVAVIAILVLVIIVVIFRSKTGDLSKEIGTCFSKGGTCVARVDYESGKTKCQMQLDEIKCSKDGQICCLNIE